MVDLPPEVEQQLAGLSEGDWAALTAKVRAPDAAEQFKAVAGQVVSGERLDALARAVDLSKFTGSDGQIDESKVMGHLTAMFGVRDDPPNYGQHSGAHVGAGSRPGDAGRAAAAKRFGTGGNSAPAIGQPATRGAGGAAEAQRRFGTKG